MKEFTANTKLDIRAIAADGAVRGTAGAGGKSVTEMTDRPRYVYGNETDEAYHNLSVASTAEVDCG